MEARQVLFLNGKNYGRSIIPQKQTNSKKKRSHLWLSAVGTGGGELEEGSQKVLTCTHKISTKAVMGLPWCLSSKESACQYRTCRFDP